MNDRTLETERIDTDTGEPIYGVYVCQWSTFDGRAVYFTGDCYEFWEPKGDGTWEYAGDLDEDEACYVSV